MLETMYVLLLCQVYAERPELNFCSSMLNVPLTEERCEADRERLAPKFEGRFEDRFNDGTMLVVERTVVCRRIG
jgi:hypothetical protein